MLTFPLNEPGGGWRYLCEQVAVMRYGKLVEYGPTEAVLDSPKEAYTRELIAAIPMLSRRLGS